MNRPQAAACFVSTLILASCVQSRDPGTATNAEAADAAIPPALDAASQDPSTPPPDASHHLDASGFDDAASDASPPTDQDASPRDAEPPDAEPAVPNDDAAADPPPDASVVVECEEPTDCPGVDGDCEWRACEDNHCTRQRASYGTACDDGDACTLENFCDVGMCLSRRRVVCAPLDSCHPGGACDPSTGLCTMPVRDDGELCVDADPCTVNDTCRSGVCTAGEPLSCNGSATCAAGSCRAPACIGATTLGTHSPIPLATAPNSVAAGDFDRDGRVELAVNGGSGIKLIPNYGDDVYGFAVDLPPAGGGGELMAIDLDEDGALDLVAGVYSSDRVDVLRNRGDGTFEMATSQATLDEPHLMTTADWNGDERPDIAVAHGREGRVSILMNAGGGTLAAPVTYPAGTRPHALAAGDFNDDGAIDLAVTNILGPTTFYGEVSILLNDGSGTFASRTAFSVGARPLAIVAGDLNGDGLDDLAVAGTELSHVSVHLNAGGGVFAPAREYSAGWGPEVMATSDVEGDGDLDVVVVNRDGRDVRVMMNVGDGTFGVSDRLPTGSGDPAVAIGDLDARDGPDIAVACFDSSHVTVLYNDGEGGFTGRGPFDIGGNGTVLDVVPVDLDANGRTDFLAVYDHVEDSVTLREYRTESGFGPPEMYPAIRGSLAAYADVDRDGFRDLLITNLFELTVVHAAGAGAFGAVHEHPLPRGEVGLRVGDVNGDGWPDVAYLDERTEYGTGNLGVMLNRGDGSFASPTFTFASRWVMSLALADVDNDGDLDAAVTGGGDDVVSVMSNDGSGTFGAAAIFPTLSLPRAVVAGDFDGDGDVDLAVSVDDFDNRGVSIFANDGSGAFQAMSHHRASADVHNLRPGDFNNDGVMDLSFSSAYSAYLLVGTADSASQRLVQYRAGAWLNGLTVADYNADGRLDLRAWPQNGLVQDLLTACMP